jgi:uncharacterized surface protein with fasciclin (FAS1) repeats
MKQFYLLLSCLLAVGTLSAQVYVDADATGAGDGTSWADAYTSLSDAIAGAAADDQVWIAAGTYVPPADSTFFIDKSLALLGGFAGTETMLDERDPAANVVTLSGDVAGDDDDFDFETNKADNALHVVFVDSLVADGVLFDGMTITKGRTQDFDSEEEDFTLYSGGGILTFSPIFVNNVTFTQNFAGDGAAIDMEDVGTAGSVLSNLTVEDNSAENFAIIQAFFTGNITLSNSTFERNSTGNRGCFYAGGCVNILVQGCTFDGNDTVNRGAGVAFVTSFPVVVRDCVFNNNVGDLGSALYLGTSSDREPMVGDATIINCQFTNNAGLRFGGAISNLEYGVNMDSCLFENNSVINATGGAWYNQSGQQVYNVSNTTFRGNSSGTADGSTSGFGGGIAFNQTGGTATLENCIFEDNATLFRGGGIAAFEVNIDVINTLFEGNSAPQGGGGITIEGNEGVVYSANIMGSEFLVNSAPEREGGAINCFIGYDLLIEDTELIGNTAGNSDNVTSGGALDISPSVLFGDGEGGTFTVESPASLTINRSIFSQNAAQGQAGAINMSNTPMVVTNSLFENNNVLLADPGPTGLQGAGGAISFNFIDRETDVTLTNNTFYNNGGLIGQDISTFHIDSTGTLTSTFTLINNAFVNELGTSYVPEPGDTTLLNVVSGGGNYVYQDTSLTAFAVASDIIEDETDLDVIFTDAEEGNFEPTDMSPLANAGVAVEGLTVDLNNHNRVGTIDIGAVEFRNTILDIVVNSDVHTTLETLVIAAGLAATLDGNGPFTVFAPTDAAFLALDPALVAAVTADPDLLRTVLLYHVVAGEAPSSSLSDGQVIETVQGENITIEIDGGNVFVRTFASQTDLAQVTKIGRAHV